MNVFDRAQNMTPPATKVGSIRKAGKDSRKDDFKIIRVTQRRMDKLAGGEGFLTYTRPPTKELFVVRGLPKALRDSTLEIDRKRMRDGIHGPGLQANSVWDLLQEFKRIEQGPMLPDYKPPDYSRLPPVQSARMPGVFATPPLPGRVHGAAAAFAPQHPNVSDYLGRAPRPLQRRY